MLSFGSAETYRKLKGMQGNIEESMKTLYPMVKEQCDQIIRTGHRFRSGNYVTFRNVEVDEYYNEAIIYLFTNKRNENDTRLNVFLNNKKNDPDAADQTDSNNDFARQSWFRNKVAGAMANVQRRRTLKVASLDTPIMGDDDDEVGSILDNLEDSDQTAEEHLSAATLLNRALTEFFSLKNRTDILMTVAYVILRNEFFPGDKYVDFVAEMNDRTVGDLTKELDSIFTEQKICVSITEIIRAAGRGKDLRVRITGLTPGKIANNKNDIQNALRKKISLRILQSEEDTSCLARKQGVNLPE